MRRLWLGVSGLLACIVLFSPAARAQDPAPTPTPAAAAPAAAVPAADEAKKDDGPGQKWIWVSVEGGGAYTDMKAFSQSNLAVQDTSQSGGLVGFGAGVRLLFLDVGFRARNNTALNLWDLDGEARFHMRMGGFDPSLAVRAGYSTVGTLNQSVGNATGTAQVDVHGWNVGAGFALDVVIAGFFTLGAEISGQVLFLTRPVPPLPDGFNLLPASVQQQVKSQPLYQASGDSVGFGAGLAARAGVQF